MTPTRRRKICTALLLCATFTVLPIVIPSHHVSAALKTRGRQEKKQLTNADIIRMVKGGFGESVIISAIQTNETQFDVSLDTLFKLKELGVSQAIIEAMQASEMRKRSLASQSQPGQSPAPRTPLYALLIQGTERLTLTPNTTARGAVVKLNEKDLGSYATNQAVGAAVIAGSLKAGAAVATATGSLGSLGILGAAGSIIGGAFLHKQATQTMVFAISGQNSSTVLQSSLPAFELFYSDIPGVNPDQYEPALVKLFPTNNNYRLFSAIKIKGGKTISSSPLVERIPAASNTIGRGHVQLSPASPLAAGEYGLVLLPHSKPEKSSAKDDAVFNQYEESIYLIVWDFSIAPATAQPLGAPQTSSPAQQTKEQPAQPAIAINAAPQHTERIEQPKDSQSSVIIQTGIEYDRAYETILNVVKREGYTIESANKETGQIKTEMAIEHGAVDIGRTVVITLIKEPERVTTVRVVAYKQGRTIGGQWQGKVYTKEKAQKLTDKIKASLSDT